MIIDGVLYLVGWQAWAVVALAMALGVLAGFGLVYAYRLAVSDIEETRRIMHDAMRGDRHA